MEQMRECVCVCAGGGELKNQRRTHIKGFEKKRWS